MDSTNNSNRQDDRSQPSSALQSRIQGQAPFQELFPNYAPTAPKVPNPQQAAALEQDHKKIQRQLESLHSFASSKPNILSTPEEYFDEGRSGEQIPTNLPKQRYPQMTQGPQGFASMAANSNFHAHVQAQAQDQAQVQYGINSSNNHQNNLGQQPLANLDPSAVMTQPQTLQQQQPQQPMPKPPQVQQEQQPTSHPLAFNPHDFGYPKILETELQLREPKSKAELEQRLNQLIGRSIGELALLAGVALPYNNQSGKGFAGQLLELYLGASAYNLTLPDFTKLNIELKTLPVDVNLLPVESTFICSIDLRSESFVPFEQSPLHHKISNLLFVLLLAPKGFPITERKILGYFYFSPTPEQMQTIREDYQDFADLVCSGHSNEINSSMGTMIQMRPKGLSSDSLIQTRDSDGNMIYSRPRGFYLRRSFTLQLCQQFLREQQVSEQELQTFQDRLALSPQNLDPAD